MKTSVVSNRLNWIVALLGLWQIVASFILRYSSVRAAMYNAIIVGVLFVIFSVWSTQTERASTSIVLYWINLILGLWLIAAPYVLRYSTIRAATSDTLIVGIIVVLLEIWSLVSMRGHGTIRTGEPISHPV